MTKKRSMGVKALGVGAVALVFGSVSFAVMPSALASTSVGPDRTVAVAKATAQPPGKVVIRDANAPRVYRFAVAVPDGGRLRSVESTRSRNKLAREILVEDAPGSPVGAFDQASALDAAGKLVPTSYRIEGTTLVQTVEFEPSTAFPVVIEPTYNKLSSTDAAAPTFGVMAVGVVTVPSNYVYNPSLAPTWAHDYCTNSPDEFYSPWPPNADFRGPCARHDMCYESGANRYGCDDALWYDMVANCEYAYPPDWQLRSQCKNTAWIYWGAVTAFGH